MKSIVLYIYDHNLIITVIRRHFVWLGVSGTQQILSRCTEVILLLTSLASCTIGGTSPLHSNDTHASASHNLPVLTWYYWDQKLYCSFVHMFMCVFESYFVLHISEAVDNNYKRIVRVHTNGLVSNWYPIDI